jgi:hypothetical protein
MGAKDSSLCGTDTRDLSSVLLIFLALLPITNSQICWGTFSCHIESRLMEDCPTKWHEI